jgi:hypothetical protein
MANADCSPEATITLREGLPLREEKKRSIVAARW